MKTSKFFVLLLTFAAAIAGCSEEFSHDAQPDARQEASLEIDQKDLEAPIDLTEIESILAAGADLQNKKSGHHKGSKIMWLPAGSFDALQAAVNDVGEGGIVVLESGLHSESGTVTLPYRVKIIGEPGAVLEVDTDPNAAPGVALDPALYLLEADKSVIWGLEINPPAGQIGGTAILVQQSEHVVIGKNSLNNHQFSIMIEAGDHAKVWGNAVEVSRGWQTGALGFAHGIIVINGDKTAVVKNSISGGLFGMWACDHDGRFLHNNLQGNFIGLLLCKVPADNYLLPNGDAAGAEFSGTSWFVAGNQASGNLNTGYVVIDGANRNTLVNNAASDNGAYDIELVGDSYRFGFLTPASYSNTVIAGKYQDILIKDCSIDNKVNGGVLVDSDLDPCY